MAKKKRSAAQKAATEKMIRAAKRARAAKAGGGSKRKKHRGGRKTKHHAKKKHHPARKSHKAARKSHKHKGHRVSPKRRAAGLKAARTRKRNAARDGEMVDGKHPRRVKQPRKGSGRYKKDRSPARKAHLRRKPSSNRKTKTSGRQRLGPARKKNRKSPKRTAAKRPSHMMNPPPSKAKRVRSRKAVTALKQYGKWARGLTPKQAAKIRRGVLAQARAKHQLKARDNPVSAGGLIGVIVVGGLSALVAFMSYRYFATHAITNTAPASPQAGEDTANVDKVPAGGVTNDLAVALPFTWKQWLVYGVGGTVLPIGISFVPMPSWLQTGFRSIGVGFGTFTVIKGGGDLVAKVMKGTKTGERMFQDVYRAQHLMSNGALANNSYNILTGASGIKPGARKLGAGAHPLCTAQSRCLACKTGRNCSANPPAPPGAGASPEQKTQTEPTPPALPEKKAEQQARIPTSQKLAPVSIHNEYAD